MQIERAMPPDSERLNRVPVCRTTLWLLPLLLAFAAPAAAQDPANSYALPAPPSSTHSLSGVVVNSVTGEPVRRALVQVVGSSAGGNPVSVLTDPEGRFEFPALPESELVLAARKPGFFNDLELHPELYQPEIVHLGADTSSLVLKLLPEGAIVGHVATVKGEPIEDSPVRILEERIVDGRKLWQERGQAMTDEDGQFRIANLIPGRYLLVTGPNLSGARLPFGQRRSARAEGFGSMFYPGVPEMEAATSGFCVKGRADFQGFWRCSRPGVGYIRQLAGAQQGGRHGAGQPANAGGKIRGARSIGHVRPPTSRH